MPDSIIGASFDWPMILKTGRGERIVPYAEVASIETGWFMGYVDEAWMVFPLEVGTVSEASNWLNKHHPARNYGLLFRATRKGDHPDAPAGGLYAPGELIATLCRDK